MNKKPNKLEKEKSPYLLQHAYNPVNWFPWCDEAFLKAKQENKPIFLSIGYSTCHWCHVMERESFEDEKIAQLMNDVFVSIKVDREERPDIDHIYMAVCQMLTGSGGWPLSIVMTPDRKPFFAGTYFPKESRYGRIGFNELIKNIQLVWKDKRDEIEENADQITDLLKQPLSVSDPKINVAFQKEDLKYILKLSFEYFRKNFDSDYGGFGSSPKFPSPHNLMFLLRYWKRYNEPESLNMVVKTLSAMKMGGIYDHLGYGFHRYSTDNKWLVPHFEKMLYDQAMLIIIFTEAYQATRNTGFKKTAEEIINYVLRDMTSTEGGFYSAEDADSEDVEGKFYLWTHEEIFKILDSEDAEIFSKVYNISPEGNFRGTSTQKLPGSNIIHLTKSIEEYSRELGIEKVVLVDRLNKCLEALYEYREKRIHPFKDDKILTDWNGLMIAALAKAGSVFNNRNYIEAAERSYHFLSSNLFSSTSGLLHRFRDGESNIIANLDDYAFLIWGLVELYKSTFEKNYISKAIELTGTAIKYFWDEVNGGFYFSRNLNNELISKTKEYYDGAIPSGNSVMLQNLVLLSRITSDYKYDELASKLINTVSRTLEKTPYVFSFLLNSVLLLSGSSLEIIIVGQKENPDTNNKLKILNEIFLPDKVVIFSDPSQEPLFDYLKNYTAVNNQTTIYVCENFKCNLPVTDINEAIRIIESSI